MRVVSVCAYNTNTNRPREQVDFHCMKFVKAVKGKGFSKYAFIPTSVGLLKLEPSNADDALGWAAEKIGAEILQRCTPHRLGLVPVPGSKHTSSRQVGEGRLSTLLLRIQTWLQARHVTDVTVMPWLWWNQEMASASDEGGPREPMDLAPHLIVAPRAASSGDRKLLIIDDVVTTRGHLRASNAVLRSAGYDVGDFAFALARTVHDVASAFAVEETELEPFTWPLQS